MKKYEGIIFDLDGVLCHTDEYHYLAWKKIADELGLYFDKTINERLRGVSRLESLEIILEESNYNISEEEKLKYAAAKNEIYKKLLNKLSHKDVSPAVENTLKTLKKQGIRLAVGSSSKNAEFILQKLEIRHYFDAVSDGNNILHSKPDPEVFLKAADFLHLKPEQCLVVEDAKAGIMAANNGDMDSALIVNEKKQDTPTYILHSLNDLLNLYS